MQPLDTIFSQLKWQIDSLKVLLPHVTFFSMEQEIYPGGRTCFELLTHIALLPEADYKLAHRAEREEIDQYYTYWAKELTTLEMIEARLDLSYSILLDAYKELELEELEQKTTSYWGTTYTQLEWLLVILTHLSHHRSQLFSFLKMEGTAPDMQLFQ